MKLVLNIKQKKNLFGLKEEQKYLVKNQDLQEEEQVLLLDTEEITKELWKTFEVCDLMYKKCKEPDPSCHNDIFFEYVNELRKQRNDMYLTWEEWEQKM